MWEKQQNIYNKKQFRMTEIIWRNEKYFWKVGSEVQCYKTLQKVLKKKKKQEREG